MTRNDGTVILYSVYSWLPKARGCGGRATIQRFRFEPTNMSKDNFSDVCEYYLVIFAILSKIAQNFSHCDTRPIAKMPQ